RRSAVATTPWIATSAGTVWPRPTMRSRTPKGRNSQPLARLSRMPMRTTSATNSWCRRWSATIAAYATAAGGFRSTSPPTPCGGRGFVRGLAARALAGLARRRRARIAVGVGMTKYSEQLDAFLETIFPPQSLAHVLGQVVADAGRSQLRMAETEKYPHVTYFL